MNIDNGGRTVLQCEDCGERTPTAIWRNGVIRCDECDGTDTIDTRGKPMARTWDEFRGGPRKRKHDRG